MRKLFLFLLPLFFVLSCTNEGAVLTNVDEELNSINERRIEQRSPFVKDGHLVFDCEESLVSFIDSWRGRERAPAEIGKQFGFESYLNAVKETKENEDIFGDEYFTGVLNKDGVIAVGDYLFKLNATTRQAFAIANSVAGKQDQMLYDATNEDQLPKASMVFSFDDDVFDLLDKGTSCVTEEKCNENCASRDKDVIDQRYCPEDTGPHRYFLHVKYGRIALWHYINVKLWHRTSIPAIGNPGNMDLRYYAKWKPRCGDESKEVNDYVCDFMPNGFPPECFPIFGGGGGGVKITFYSKTRCLSKYRLLADARIVSACDPTEMIWTNVVEIRDGY